MAIPHRGGGIAVVIIGILSALTMNIVTNRMFDNNYYENNVWPRFGTLWLAGFGCILLSFFLTNRDSRIKKIDKDSFTGEGKPASAGGHPLFDLTHHLFFIPVIYWGMIFFVIGIIFAGVSLWKSRG